MINANLVRLTAVVLGCALGAFVATTMAQSPPQNFTVHERPKPAAEIKFEDKDGNTRGLSDFRGKVVLLNVWATWCAPCRREMPTLDHLQAELGGAEFEVLALSIDRLGIKAVRKFYGEIGVKHLAIYIDPSSKAMRQLAVLGLPTTLLLDSQGQEIGRLIGPAEWDAPEMVAFIRSKLEDKAGRADPQRKHPSPVPGHANEASSFRVLLESRPGASATPQESSS